MKTIVITGGAGFIGSHLCDLFISKGYRVICLDNLITGSLDNIAHLINKPEFIFIRHDVSQHIDLAALLAKEKGGASYNPSGKNQEESAGMKNRPGGKKLQKLEIDLKWVLHFASLASPVYYLNYPIQTLKVGSLGTHNALGLAKAWGAGFLLASTSEVYGDPLVHPQTEDYWGNVNSIGVRGCYDESKRFAEAITMAYHRVHKLNTKIVRIFNTYGPRMRKEDGRVVPAFIDQAQKDMDLTVFGDGSQTRSFCYIEDLIVGIYRLLEADTNYPVNLGNPEEFTVKELADKIMSIISPKSKIIYRSLPVDDPKRRRPDITLAGEKLGWRPKISLAEGIKKTIEWFKKN